MSEKSPQQPSTSDLIGRLSEQTSRLVRDEMKLARAEMIKSAKDAGIGAGAFSAAGVLAAYGFAALVATGIIAFALVVPAWLAALIVTIVLFVAAAIAGIVGRSRVQKVSVTPDQTINSIKQDVNEVKGETK